MRRFFIALMLVATALGHGDTHEAILAITAEIAKAPNDTDLLLRRGELHSQHQDWAAAAADFDRVAKLAPELVAVDLCRGKMHLAAGKPAAAVKALDRLIKKHPDHAAAFLSRARAKLQLREYAAAAADYTKAITLSTQPEPEFYIERANALAAQGPKQREPAIRSLDEGIEKLGPIVTLILPAIELEVGTKKYDAALARLERFTATMPRKDSWLARRAEILAKAGRKDEALAAYQSTLTAIDALPHRTRQAKATADLRVRIEAQIASLKKP